MTTLRTSAGFATTSNTMARELMEAADVERPIHLATYTFFVSWGSEVEEVDVHASTAQAARTCAEAELTANYKPGWQITRVVERAAGTFYI